jgi:uncharacterized protein YoxC
MMAMALLPSPSAVLHLTRYAAGQVVETVAAAATVPVRVLGLLGQTELLVSRMAVLAERAEILIDRVERVTAEAEETVAGVKPIMQRVERVSIEAENAVGGVQAVMIRVGTVITTAEATTDAAGDIIRGAAATTSAATQVVAQAQAISATAQELLGLYGATLRRAAPLLGRFVGDLTPEEVTAAIRMVDQLPALRKHLTEDVMPLLGKLDQVGPDLHSLLEVTNDLRLAIVGMPGLKLLRRRGAERVAEENDDDGR